MPRNLSKKAKSATYFFTWEVFQAWVLPSLSIPATIMIGWLASVPWFYVWLGMGFMFAATATGLLRFSEWQSRVTVKHKLAFSRVRLRKALSDNNAVSALSLGFDLQSAAEFPLQFEIKRLETQFANQYPPKKDYEQPVIMLRPNQEGWFNDHFISLEKVDLKGKTAEGTISAQIRYGRPGNLTQEFEIKKRIYIKFNAEVDIAAIEWHDI